MPTATIVREVEPTRPASAPSVVDPLDPRALQASGAAEHLELRDCERLRGRCSLWTADTPRLDGDAIGLIGHFSAADAGAAAALLRWSCDRAAAAGHATVVGPMDGSTWRSYRLVTWHGDAPQFFLEPGNPPAYPRYFEAAGFAPLAGYLSTLNLDLAVDDPRVPAALDRLRGQGIAIRPLDPSRFEEEMRAVHELSLAAFADNFLYTPIRFEQFLDLYLPLRPLLRPELVLLAERAGQLVGFVFGLPDMLEAKRGERVRTLIVKTVAVRPERACAGLGAVLVDQCQQAARRLGFTRAIHALMHDANPSRNIAARYGSLMRRYTLYSRAAAP